MYLIGRLAKLAGVKTDSIRFYERQGLLTSTRKAASGYHLYSEDALRRIDFIKHAQRCGFSLIDIRELLQLHGDGNTSGDVDRFVHAKQAEIEKTLSDLQRMSGFLSELVKRKRRNETPAEMTLRGPKRAATQYNAPGA